MNEYFLIYILSIAAGFSDTLRYLGVMLFWLPLCTYVVVYIIYIMAKSETRHEALTRIREDHAVREPILRKLLFILGTIGLSCTLASSCIPTTRTVIEAYAIVEGSKVINADNAEAAGEAVGKRFDQFLGIIDKSLNGAKMVEEGVDKAVDLKDKAIEKAKALKKDK